DLKAPFFGWTDGTNGGTGWGSPWSIHTGGTFAGSSATNGAGDLDGDGDINAPHNANGRAWGMKATAATPTTLGDGVSAQRMLNGPLSVGQTFKIDFDNGTVDRVADEHLVGAGGWGIGGPDAG